jgi:hypothetical protein
MEDQRILHWVITNEFTLNAPAPVVDATMQNVLVDPLTVIPNQTNILDQIADLEADQIDEDIKYALAAADEDKVITEDFTVTLKDGTIVEHEINAESNISSITLHDKNIEIHVESDQEYLERVVEIEGEPEIIDLDDEEDKDWEKLEVAGIITPFAAHDVETEKEETELVQYTDPAGNTFELPMIKESEIPAAVTQMPQEIMDALVNAPEMDVSKVDMSKVTWIDAPEVAPDRVKFAIDETEDDDFNITFDLGSDDVSTEHDEFF